MSSWEERFQASTRGQVIALLRRRGHTVEELAQALDLTDNAIRAQLTALERDGLVRQHGTRRGGSRPAALYRLTPQAERLFPKAYETSLRHLAGALLERLPLEECEQLLRLVGRRIAQEQGLAAGDAEQRLQRSIAVLGNLGALVEVERHEGTTHICCYSCPLAGVTAKHKIACKLMEAMLAELAGLPVQERCERNEEVACWFEVSLPAQFA
ncbi:MAG: helix-turn-helix domain-containing protein [Chloroflexota bacterium]|nr:helix-turn-helix domain-containing protein [Chloroflexota bacterium]